MEIPSLVETADAEQIGKGVSLRPHCLQGGFHQGAAQTLLSVFGKGADKPDLADFQCRVAEALVVGRQRGQRNDPAAVPDRAVDARA